MVRPSNTEPGKYPVRKLFWRVNLDPSACKGGFERGFERGLRGVWKIFKRG